MPRRLLIAFIVSCILFLPTIASTADNKAATTEILPNGAQITLVTDTTSDIAAFHLAIPISPAGIPEAKTGIRDVLQQLILDRLSDAISENGELRELGQALPAGAKIDVTAEMEYIEIRVSVPSTLMRDVLTAVCDELFAARQYTPEQITSAKQSVTEAYQQNMAAVAERTYRLFTRALYGKGPFTRDMATVIAGVSEISANDIATSRALFYVPSKTYITVVAPIPHDQILACVKVAIGQYGNASKPQATISRAPLLPDADIQIASDKGLGQASLIVGVPLPSYGTREFLAGQVAFMLLAGPNGRFTDDQMLHSGFGLMLPRSVYEQQPPFEAMAPRPASAPFIAVHIIANPVYIEDARATVLGHFAALQHGAFTETELAEAKAQLSNRYAQAYSTYIARAQLVNLNAMFGGHLDASMEFEQAISSLTMQDVTDMARENFAHHAIGLQMPGI